MHNTATNLYEYELFNRNILYCKYYMCNEWLDDSDNLIETFCIVNCIIANHIIPYDDI